jgi:ubiquinone biosynthesis protein UbiJ
MKEEALKLADEWDWMTEEKLAKWGDDVQATIRRLVEEVQELEAEVDALNQRIGGLL